MHLTPYDRPRRALTVYALAVPCLLGAVGTPHAVAGGIPMYEAQTAEVLGLAKPSPDQPGAWVAEIVRPVDARRAPRDGAPVIQRVDPFVGGSSTVTSLLATEAHRQRPGTDWIRVQLDTRPNQTTAWVKSDAVVLRKTPVRIVVRLASRRLDVWRGSVRLASFPAGIGGAATPTPTGQFAVRNSWSTDATERSRYGSRVFALTAHSNVLLQFDGGNGRIAIHGTQSASRIGRRSSYGCVVVSEHVLRMLQPLAAPGTPVAITAR